MTRTSSFVSMTDEDLANFDLMSAFEELLPENINVTERIEESGTTCNSGDAQINKKSRFAVVENRGLDALVEIVQARKSLKEATKFTFAA